jgi:hypothetical protein
MSSVTAVLGLQEVCFPDITGKVLRAWGQVLINTPGAYVTGGLPMGLIKFADDRTVDFNGFLRCEVWDEEVQTVGLVRYHYNPVTDTLQVFTPAGVEIAAGTALPITSAINVDGPMTQVDPALIMFEASWDRTTVRG